MHLKGLGFVFTILISIITGFYAVEVGHIASGQVFPVSAIDIVSPANTTYSSNNLNLTLTFTSLLGPEHTNLCYSLDGLTNVTIPLTGTQEPKKIETTYENGTTEIVNSTKYSPFSINGNIVLSGLSEGSHHIIVYANYTANSVTSYDKNEEYFTIDTKTETSPISEFPEWTPLLIVAFIVIVMMIIYKYILNKLDQ